MLRACNSSSYINVLDIYSALRTYSPILVISKAYFPDFVLQMQVTLQCDLETTFSVWQSSSVIKKISWLTPTDIQAAIITFIVSGSACLFAVTLSKLDKQIFVSHRHPNSLQWCIKTALWVIIKIFVLRTRSLGLCWITILITCTVVYKNRCVGNCQWLM